jgi:hypothetical protein
MSLKERPDAVIILSLIGGIVILLGSIMTFMALGYGSNGYGMMGSLGGMMHGYTDMMGGFGVPFGFMGVLSLAGTVSGLIVIVGAVIIGAYPANHYAWGIVILVFSIVSFLGMGGFFIGAILGIIGGSLALSWTPTADT